MSQEAEEQLAANKDANDALAMALYTAMAIPPSMTVNMNGRTYPKELLMRQFQRMAEKMRKIVIEHVDEWPGRFENEETPGAVAWCRNWDKPVKALEWSPPAMKPPSQWHDEVRKYFGVVGDVVPISVKPLPRHEQTSLSQTWSPGALVCDNPNEIERHPDIPAHYPAEPGAEPEGPALRHDRQPQAGQDRTGA